MLRKLSSAEPVQLAAPHQWGGDKAQILITKTATSLLQIPTWTPPLQVFSLLDPLECLRGDNCPPPPPSTLRLLLHLDRIVCERLTKSVNVWDTGLCLLWKRKGSYRFSTGDYLTAFQSYNGHVFHSLSLIRMCASVCLLLFCYGNICALQCLSLTVAQISVLYKALWYVYSRWI